MSRYLTPRAIGLGLLAVVLMTVMTLLGLWQLGVYDEHQHADAEAGLARQPVPLDEVLAPDAAFPSDGVGRPVKMTGHYAPAEHFWVRGMPGADGRYSTVSPLVTVSGSAILVVRGSADTRVGEAPSGSVTVNGILEPSGANGGRLNAQRTTSGIRIASLVQDIHPDLYAGYVLLRTSTPPQSTALTPVQPPLPDPSAWAGIRNLMYACQWWVFAAFVAFMWWRICYDRPEPDEAAQGAGAGTGSSGGTGTGTEGGTGTDTADREPRSLR
ncbi:MAG: SURF1 family protein [Nocardioidaceae bacterium]